MKRQMKSTVLLSLCLLLSACSGLSITNPNQVVGSGNVISETRTISGVTRLVSETAGSVNVAFGNEEKVVIEADDNILPLLSVEVRNGTLTLGMRGSFTSEKGIHYTVTLKKLEAARVNNAGSIRIDDIDAAQLELKTNNAGSIVANGTAGTLLASASNAGGIDVSNLKAGDATVEVSNAGSVKVWAENSLDATITLSGAGSISYYGTPSLTQHDSGPGSIRSLGQKEG